MSELEKEPGSDMPTDPIVRWFVDNTGKICKLSVYPDGSEVVDENPTLNELAASVQRFQQIERLDPDYVPPAEATTHVIGQAPDVNKLREIVGLPPEPPFSIEDVNGPEVLPGE